MVIENIYCSSIIYTLMDEGKEKHDPKKSFKPNDESIH